MNTQLAPVSDQATAPMPQRPILDFQDWRAFVSTPAASAPKVPSYFEYQSLQPPFKKRVDQQRRQYQQTFGPIEVPSMHRIQEATIRLAMQNLRAPAGVRPGVVIDGIATVGKTTTVLGLGKYYERKLTKNHTNLTTPDGNEYIPVAYVTLPAEMAIYDFNLLLAKFYNIPISRSSKAAFITERIKEHAANCGTSLFIIDDIHFLQIRNRSHAVLNNHLKHLASCIPATFVYAGIGCEGTGLLADGFTPERASFTQTGHRFKKYDVTPFSLTSPDARNEFDAVLSFFEKNMLLYEQTAGSLARDFGEYIFQRTGGYMGAISSLLREAAGLAITKGTEKITQQLLNSVRLSHESERAYRLIANRRQLVAERMT